MSAFMETLKERLLMEQERMERIMEKAKERLRNAPEGTLRLSSCRKTVQYYHCLPGGEKNGTYIPKEQMELVRSLAQKSYDEKVMRLAGKRLAQLRKLTKDYEDDEQKVDENKYKEALINNLRVKANNYLNENCALKVGYTLKTYLLKKCI